MNTALRLLYPFGAAAMLAGLSPAVANADTAARPNVIFILADDLGYGDVGVTYQNQRGPTQPRFATPHLDAMAKDGLLLRSHYSAAPVCAPARASLLSGLHQGHCNVRDNQFDKALANNHTVATVLKTAGYDTFAIGKWGLQGTTADQPGHPTKRGFDGFFGYLAHESGHVYYHDAAHPLEDNGRDVTADYADVYDTDLFTAKAKQYLAAHAAATGEKKPFFLYLAYTAPHADQGLPGGAYPSGSGATAGLQWPLKATPQTKDAWIDPAVKDAVAATQPDAAPQPWKPRMKRYATVVRRLDQCVGDLLQTLRDLKLADNTLVVFTSDNGPSAAGVDPRWFDSWGPFDGFKRDLFEGGLREPAVAWWPGRISAGRTSDEPSNFCDWLPTFSQVAGLTPPAIADGVSLLPTLLDQPGQRRSPFLYSEYFVTDPKQADGVLADVQRRKGTTGRLNQQWMRVGDFVACRVTIKSPADPLRLYNVVTDPHQDHDLAADPAYAAKLAEFNALFPTVRRPLADAKRPYDDVPLPAVTTRGDAAPGVSVDFYAGRWPWVPDVRSLVPIRTIRTNDLALPADVPAGPFAAQFSTTFVAPASGQYTFRVTSDGGAALWLHHARLIDDDFARTGEAISATVNLEAGPHPLRLIYRHDGDPSSFKLEVTGPDSQTGPIARKLLLFPTTP